MSADLSLARHVAHLMDPTQPPPGGGITPPEQYAELLAACRRNKVPLLALGRGAPRWQSFYASDAFQRAHANERAEWAHLRDEYGQVHQAWEAEGIADVLIKSVGLAPALPYRSDNLDALVLLRDGTRARALLRALGYVELKNVEEPHKFLFRKLHLGQTVAIVHLHESVGWGTGFLDDARVVQRARPAADDPQVRIPAPEEALLITLAHAFYEDKAVTLGDIWKVRHLLQTGALDWDALYQQAGTRGWCDGLATCLVLWAELERRLYGSSSLPAEMLEDAQDRLPDDARRYLAHRLASETRFPYGLSFAFSKRLYYRKVRRDRALSWPKKARDALRHSLAGVRRRLPFQSQPAMLVSLSGVDGCGKTTYAELLQRACAECGIRAEVAWSRGASSRLTDGVIRLLKPWLARSTPQLDATSATRPARLERQRVWLRRPGVRAGWSVLVAMDLLLHYALRVAWPLARGCVVICDRYIYDALVEQAAVLDDGSVARAAWARVLVSLCPRPRLAFWLDVTPQQAWARKPEEPLAFLESQSAAWQRLAGPWGLERVDADRPLEEVADQLTCVVLSAYYRDWRTFLNGIFLANPRRDEGGKPCAS